MDPTQWLAALTSLGAMATAWLEARTAHLEFETAKKEVIVAGASAAAGAPSEEREFASELVISQDLLSALIADVEKAQTRFASVFVDVRYTPAQVDQEEQIARATICRHLQRIRDFNAGKLPGKRLEKLWDSFRCGRTRPEA